MCSFFFAGRANTDSESADISGVPGTGQTATAHTVVELKRMAEQIICSMVLERLCDTYFFPEETNAFTYVEINGMLKGAGLNTGSDPRQIRTYLHDITIMSMSALWSKRETRFI